MALLDRNGVYGAPRFHMEGTEVRRPSAHRRGDCRQRFGPTTSTCLISTASASGGTCAPAAAGGVTHRLSESLPPYHSLQATREHEGRRHGAYKDFEEYGEGLVCLTGGSEGPLAAALAQGGYDAAQKSR